MMGYTHAAIGAAGATGIAIAMGSTSTETYVLAVTLGVVGGVLVDVDVRDSKNDRDKMTDASRTRWAMLGITLECFVLDYLMGFGILQEIILRKYVALIGAGLLGLALFAARWLIKGHRTFSHSLLFVFLTTTGIFLIYPPMTVYYFIGSLLHLLIDLLNNHVPGPNDDWDQKHGIWLLYPLKIGNGIALRLCKAGGPGNKIIYFVGIIAYFVLSGLYCWYGNMLLDTTKIIPIAVVLIYVLVSLHFVRTKSEAELQGSQERKRRGRQHR